MQNECKNSAFFIYLFFNAISTRVASCLFNVISSAARSIMFGSNGEYEYCLWSFAARSIVRGNNSEYEYCLWSFAARSIMYGNNGEYGYCLWCCAARSIMYGNNGEYEYCLWSFAARSIVRGNNGEYDYCLWSFARRCTRRGAEKAAKGCAKRGVISTARIVLCSATKVSMNIAFGLSRASLRAERRNLLFAVRKISRLRSK